MVNEIEFILYQRGNRTLPVLGPFSESEAKFDIAINSGIDIANMHLKMESKIKKINLIQGFNCLLSAKGKSHF